MERKENCDISGTDVVTEFKECLLRKKRLVR